MTVNSPSDASQPLVNCDVLMGSDATIETGDDSFLHNCKIRMGEATKLIIGDYTHLVNTNIFIPTQAAVVRIGNFCQLANGTKIHCDRYIRLADYNLVAPGCFITDSQIHHVDAELRVLEIENMRGWKNSIPKRRTCRLTIGSKCWFGAYSQIHVAKLGEEKLIVPDATILAAGAILKNSIAESHQIWAGVPAVYKGPATQNLTSQQIKSLRNY